MKIMEPGHIYALDELDGTTEHNVLTFVNREKGSEHPGTQTQEVLRALIDRTVHCDNCLRWSGNDEIIFHLRAALVLHEQRAMMRKLEKGLIKPEFVDTGSDGHFLLTRAGSDARAYTDHVAQFERQLAHPLDYGDQ